jgi:hypothetical protein
VIGKGVNPGVALVTGAGPVYGARPRRQLGRDLQRR